MSEGGEEKPDDGPPLPLPPPVISGEAMDVDLELESSWSFDAGDFLRDSSIEYFLLSSSPLGPLQSSLQFPQASPPQSPLLSFEQRVTEVSDAVPEISNLVPGEQPTTSNSMSIYWIVISRALFIEKIFGFFFCSRFMCFAFLRFS